MSAKNINAATVKEDLTVRAWGIDGESVVKYSLTTDSDKNDYSQQQDLLPRTVDSDFERVDKALKAMAPVKRVTRTEDEK